VSDGRARQPQARRDGGHQPVDAPEAPVSGFEEERARYAAEHPEAPESAPEEAGSAPQAEEAAALEGDIAELQAKAAERDEYLALAQRAQADFENYRKRAAKDVAAAESRGVARLARELLPALDNFERALAAAESQPENRDHHLTDGIRLVQTELLSALARVGIEPESPKGEAFDPHRHEAVAQHPVEGAQPGTIVEVYQAGYRYGDELLRPAKVVVAA
jgi:molecular chaperone GrpE